MSSSSIISRLLLLILSLPSLFVPIQATDTLTPGQSLKDGNSLISAGELFELGFFSPSNSTNRYVGIWYRNLSPDVVVWVANRETPVLDKSGSLTISANGNLILIDIANKTIWSSNASSLPSDATTAKLLDSGNLQLNNSTGMVWQSFDFPTDTYLPGMKIGLDLATNENQLLTSWKSTADPGAGNYSIGMDPKRSTQIFIWDGEKPWWRSGRWDGHVFIGIDYMTPIYTDGFQVTNDTQEGKMYFYDSPGSVSHRFVLRWDGVLERFAWSQDTKAWSLDWAQPMTECEYYNKCGDYGVCIEDNTPKCDCLQGYKPKSTDEWSKGNWSRGCIRRTPLQCEMNGSISAGKTQADRFLMLERVKVPDLSDWYQDVVEIGGCEQICLANCSCKAYAYIAGTGCLIWGVDLVDIRVLSSAGNVLYLRLAGSELDDKKERKKVAVIVIVTVVAVIIISVVGCCYLVWKYRTKAFSELRQSQHQGIIEGPNDILGSEFKITDEQQEGKNIESLLLGFDIIVAATENFSPVNLLGKGGFGQVYKGTLPGGQEIAVKRLSASSRQGLEEFKNEVILISKLQHRNLVRLLGCCIQGQEKILIYEYMPNSSLDAFLFDASRKRLLDWVTRFNIIQGIVRGLLYLHRDSRLRVIHRDLKASNILLDETMNPKISDFGIARIFGQDDNETNTNRVIGTYGYMSPEYAMHGLFSVKSDVYSFGVLLLEILSGKKNNTYDHPELSLGLRSYAWKLWNEGNAMEFVDPSIRDSCSLTEVSRCINVGLLCVQDRAADRPTMSSVLVMLESGITDHAMPRQPTFFAERTPSETTTSTTDLKLSATVSTIILTGR